MEDLNKNQIVLLTLLVSFVTSIATGIMTTTLLQQAPVEVTRNINRIVERTIETVTPANAISSITSKPTTTTTIVINEDDSVTQSVDKNVKSIARIKEYDQVLGLTTFYGIGVVVSKDGLIATDRKTISFANTYSAIMSDGTNMSLTPTGVDKQTDFIVFKAKLLDTKPDALKMAPYVFVPITMSNSEPKLGQTVISLGGELESGVSVGRVTSLEIKDQTVGTTTTKYLDTIHTDVSTKDIVDGMPVLNLSGEVVGIKLTTDEQKSFTPISVLKKELTVLVETPPTAPKTP